jgi:hypothetical protein
MQLRLLWLSELQRQSRSCGPKLLQLLEGQVQQQQQLLEGHMQQQVEEQEQEQQQRQVIRVNMPAALQLRRQFCLTTGDCKKW